MSLREAMTLFFSFEIPFTAGPLKVAYTDRCIAKLKLYAYFGLLVWCRIYLTGAPRPEYVRLS